MTPAQYEEMRKAHIAPCGCEVVFEVWDGVEHQHVSHSCNPHRTQESNAANKKSHREHMERQERNMLLHSIPLATLRHLVAGDMPMAKEKPKPKSEEPARA